MSLPERLTAHFLLREFEVTRTGLPLRVPDLATWWALRTLCVAALEPWREVVGPLRITSGWRSPEVNTAVGGSTTTAHDEGLAADVIPTRMSSADAYAELVHLMDRGRLPVDQAILYSVRGHVHVGIRLDGRPRRERWVDSRT